MEHNAKHRIMVIRYAAGLQLLRINNINNTSPSKFYSNWYKIFTQTFAIILNGILTLIRMTKLYVV